MPAEAGKCRIRTPAGDRAVAEDEIAVLALAGVDEDGVAARW